MSNKTRKRDKDMFIGRQTCVLVWLKDMRSLEDKKAEGGNRWQSTDRSCTSG